MVINEEPSQLQFQSNCSGGCLGCDEKEDYQFLSVSQDQQQINLDHSEMNTNDDSLRDESMVSDPEFEENLNVLFDRRIEGSRQLLIQLNDEK